MEEMKAKMIVNKSGSGSSTFRVTLKTNWIREMGLGENNRDLKIQFDGKKIIITNNEEEVTMLKNLLERAKLEIEKEIKDVGFIDDSDNIERFLDNLATDLVANKNLDEDLSIDLLEDIKDHMDEVYQVEGSVDKRGTYTGCYYKNEKGLEKWNEILSEYN